MAQFKTVIRTLMSVVVVAFCATTFYYYTEQGKARAEALVPTLPDFEHTNNQQFLNNVKDTDIIYRHNYRMPTLINGQLPHTANDKYMKRLYIGITLFFKQKSNSLWHDIDEYYNNGELFHGL